MHTTDPEHRESAGREYRRDPAKVRNAHHLPRTTTHAPSSLASSARSCDARGNWSPSSTGWIPMT